MTGSSSVYLPILHYTLLSYSKAVSSFLDKNNHILFAKNEYQFVEEVFTLLDRHFGYKSPITVGQFFTCGNGTCT